MIMMIKISSGVCDLSVLSPSWGKPWSGREGKPFSMMIMIQAWEWWSYDDYDYNNFVSILMIISPWLWSKVSGDCIRCPFHDWKFDGSTGACVQVVMILMAIVIWSIIMMIQVPYDKTSKVPGKARVDTFHCLERNRLVMVIIIDCHGDHGHGHGHGHGVFWLIPHWNGISIRILILLIIFTIVYNLR